MHGVIATYERVYFMIGIVYSSKTGNTQSLANSLNFMESKLKSLWNHENEEREKQGKELINVFQFGFSILDIKYLDIFDLFANSS